MQRYGRMQINILLFGSIGSAYLCVVFDKILIYFLFFDFYESILCAQIQISVVIYGQSSSTQISVQKVVW